MTLARRKAATKAEAAYQDRARELGCVVCRHRHPKDGPRFDPWMHQGGATEIHHRNLGDLHGQKQLGQDAVVALCSYHHRGVIPHGWSPRDAREQWGPSFALHPRDFREWTYDVLPGLGKGTEAWQKYQDELLGE
jgi:hypothetical protein